MDKVKLIKNIAFSTVFAVLVLLSVYYVIAANPGVIWDSTQLNTPVNATVRSGTIPIDINSAPTEVAFNVTNVTFYFVNLSGYQLIGFNLTQNLTNYTLSWDTTSTQGIALPDGTYGLIANITTENRTAQGEGGVFSNYTGNLTLMYNITIDNTDPQLGFYTSGGTKATPENNARRNTVTTITVGVDNVNDTNFNRTVIYFYNTTWINHTTIRTRGVDQNQNATLDVSTIGDGTYYFNITIFDNATNQNASAARTYIKDATSPATTTLTVPSSDIRFGNSAEIKCANEDATTGVNNTEVTITRPSGTTAVLKDFNSTHTSVTFLVGSGSSGDLDTLGTFDVDCVATDRAGNTNPATKKTIRVVAPEAGGGAGGGGGRSYSWNPETTTEKTQLMRANDKVVFTIKDVEHTATITTIGTDSVIVTIASLPITVTVKLGEIKKVDFEKDAVYDLTIELKNIMGTRANVEFTAISEAYTLPKEPEGEGPTPTKKPISTIVWWIVGIIALIVVIAIIYSATKKKKK